MKEKKLKRAFIINLVIFFILFVTLVTIFFYTNNSYNNSKTQVQKSKAQTASLIAKTSKVKSQIKDYKKYKELWKSIPKNKINTKIVKVTNVNSILNNIANIHNIKNQEIKMLIPKIIQESQFKKKTIDIYHTNGSINFNSYDDVRALKFLKEFSLSMPGHFIIKSLNIVKTKDYKNRDLIGISQGEDTIAALKVEAKFSWYSYRDAKNN